LGDRAKQASAWSSGAYGWLAT